MVEMKKIKKSRREVIYGRFLPKIGGIGVKNDNLNRAKIHCIYNVFAYVPVV